MALNPCETNNSCPGCYVEGKNPCVQRAVGVLVTRQGAALTESHEVALGKMVSAMSEAGMAAEDIDATPIGELVNIQNSAARVAAGGCVNAPRM